MKEVVWGLGGGVVEEILFHQVTGVKEVLECYLESVHDETAKAARACFILILSSSSLVR